MTATTSAVPRGSRNLTVPFVWGVTNLGEALRRSNEGAEMIRPKGEAGAGGIASPARRAAAVVKATTFSDDPDVIAKVSSGRGEAMVGINADEIPQPTASPSAACR